MAQFFKKFDLDLEGQEMEEMCKTKLSLLEKAFIFALTSYASVLIRKANKAKTYGDVIKIMKRFEAFADKKGFEKDTEPTQEEIEEIIQELEDETLVVKHLEL